MAAASRRSSSAVPSTVIVGALMTVLAGVIAIVGTVLAGTRPGLAALLMIVAAPSCWSRRPGGIIPALADSVVVFMAYLAGDPPFSFSELIIAFRERKAVPNAALTGLPS